MTNSISKSNRASPMNEKCSLDIKLVGEKCGQHSCYTFHKAVSFVHPAEDIKRMLVLGEFFYLRIARPTEQRLAIGELQLVWKDHNVNAILASLRVYFLPEHTIKGKYNNYCEHEVFQASHRVIVKVSDLVPLIDYHVTKLIGIAYHWNRTEMDATPTTTHGDVLFPDQIPSTYLQSIISHNPCGKSVQFKSNFELFHVNATKVNLCDVLTEKKNLSRTAQPHQPPETSTVVVLPLSRYCRLRALLKRIEGRATQFLNHVSFQQILLGLGIPFERNSLVQIVFCRDTFKHKGPLLGDFNCEHLAPCLKGRPRKRKAQDDNCAEENLPVVNKRVTRSSKSGLASQLETVAISPAQKKNSQVSVVKGVVSQKFLDCLKQASHTHEIDKKYPSHEVFMKHLNAFMNGRGTPIDRPPLLGFMRIDLFVLFTLSQKLGGYQKVTEARAWKDLFFYMGGDQSCTSAATNIRKHYERLLLPFENHMNESTINANVISTAAHVRRTRSATKSSACKKTPAISKAKTLPKSKNQTAKVVDKKKKINEPAINELSVVNESHQNDVCHTNSESKEISSSASDELDSAESDRDQILDLSIGASTSPQASAGDTQVTPTLVDTVLRPIESTLNAAPLYPFSPQVALFGMSAANPTLLAEAVHELAQFPASLHAPFTPLLHCMSWAPFLYCSPLLGPMLMPTAAASNLTSQECVAQLFQQLVASHIQHQQQQQCEPKTYPLAVNDMSQLLENNISSFGGATNRFSSFQ